MSEPYLWIKWIHILSGMLLFGTGLGTAFHLYATHLRGDVAAIAAATRNTVLADWDRVPARGVTSVWVCSCSPVGRGDVQAAGVGGPPSGGWQVLVVAASGR